MERKQVKTNPNPKKEGFKMGTPRAGIKVNEFFSKMFGSKEKNSTPAVEEKTATKKIPDEIAELIKSRASNPAIKMPLINAGSQEETAGSLKRNGEYSSAIGCLRAAVNNWKGIHDILYFSGDAEIAKYATNKIEKIEKSINDLQLLLFFSENGAPVSAN